MQILTFVKHCFERNLWQELIDPSDDFRLGGAQSVSVPDLEDVFSVSYADADADDFVLCKNGNAAQVGRISDAFYCADMIQLPF